MNINNSFFQRRKGQSAIEYLMTYGWMLLVVAIVGGAIFATVQGNNQGCDGTIPMSLDATQQGFGVSNFGASAGNTQVVLTNNGQDTANVNNVTVNAAGAVGFATSAPTVQSGQEEVTVNIDGGDGFSDTDTCNPVEISINHSMGGLTNQVISGNVTAQIG